MSVAATALVLGLVVVALIKTKWVKLSGAIVCVIFGLVLGATPAGPHLCWKRLTLTPATSVSSWCSAANSRSTWRVTDSDGWPARWEVTGGRCGLGR